jgi:fructoselysine and glucoselysine-specific PTS system IIA component
MRNILLASHSYLAKGMKDTVEMILGKQENLYTLCAYVTENYNLISEIESVLTSIDVEDEWIIVTDVFGGSVNNELINYIGSNQRRDLHLVSGMNLGLLMSLLTMVNSTNNTSSIINEAIEQSKKTIMSNDQLIFFEQQDVMDDF